MKPLGAHLKAISHSMFKMSCIRLSCDITYSLFPTHMYLPRAEALNYTLLLPFRVSDIYLIQYRGIVQASMELIFAWWRHQLLCYCSFVRGIHRSLVNSQHKGQWCGAFMFSLICVWYGWVNNCEAGDLRRYCAHYDVTVIIEGNALGKKRPWHTAYSSWWRTGVSGQGSRVRG